MSPRAADGEPTHGALGTGAGREARPPALPEVRRQVGAGGVLASVVATVNLTAASGAIKFVYPVTGQPGLGQLPGQRRGGPGDRRRGHGP